MTTRRVTHEWLITLVQYGEVLRVETFLGSDEEAEEAARRDEQATDARFARVAAVVDGVRVAFKEHETVTFSIGIRD